MRWIIRVLGFLLGAGVAGVALFALGFRFPHAWMPLAMGTIVALVVGAVAWAPKGAFALGYGGAWIAGPFVLWLISSTNLQKIPPYVLLLFKFAIPLAVILLITAVVSAIRLKDAQRKVAMWLLLALFIGLDVAYFSGPSGRAGFMRTLLMDLGLSAATADTTAVALRKAVHFTAYGVLAWFWVKAALAGGLRKPDAAGFALCMTLTVAAFDEMRQSTMPMRTGSAFDVLIDMAGAIVFISFAKATKGVRSK